MQVQDCMQTVVVTVIPEDRVSTAPQRMRGGRIRRLPVVSGGNKLVGVVTDRNERQATASDEPHMAATHVRIDGWSNAAMSALRRSFPLQGRQGGKRR